MKIHHTTWGRHYSTPYITVLPYKGDHFIQGYIQISFVIWNHHWWIIINKKKLNLNQMFAKKSNYYKPSQYSQKLSSNDFESSVT